MGPLQVVLRLAEREKGGRGGHRSLRGVKSCLLPALRLNTRLLTPRAFSNGSERVFRFFDRQLERQEVAAGLFILCSHRALQIDGQR